MNKPKSNGLIFISNVQKALEHEWFCDYIDKNLFNIEFVLFNSKHSELYNYIVKQGFKCKNYSLPSKYLIPYYISLFWLKCCIKRYDFIHCHLFEASLIGIISGKLAKIKKRIYTRHHSDFHHVYFPSAVKYDLLINKYSTHIIAVSNNIKTILIQKENVSSDKITVIPHGLPSSVLNIEISEKEISEAKLKYNYKSNYPIIGVISRFTEWKGIQYIIPAFKLFIAEHKNAKLVLANAHGDYEPKIKELLSELPDESYILIPFENNILPLFKTFDMFIHVPIDKNSEAFGQVYIEAMAVKVPMICTLSGIANDFIVNEKNALVVDYKNADDIYKTMCKLINTPELKNRIIKEANNSVQFFSFETKINTLKKIYLD